MNNLEEQIKLSRKVIIEMLQDRGYNTEQCIHILPEQLFLRLWSKFTNESNVFDIECENKVGERIYVTYIKNHVISKKNNKTKYENLKKKHKILLGSQDLLFNDKIIYVICDTKDEDIMKTYEDFNKQNRNVELFDINRLLINITKHSFVPKHIKMSIKDTIKLKHNLQIDSIYKLPVISNTDPVARYYNLKRGDVVQIIRNSQSYGSHISYRVCSDIEH